MEELTWRVDELRRTHDELSISAILNIPSKTDNDTNLIGFAGGSREEEKKCYRS